MIEKIHRIGIAVKDLEKAKHFFLDVLGAKEGVVYRRDETEHFNLVADNIPSEGLKSFYVTLGGLQIELMSATNSDGNIGRFLQKHGEGLMTISLKVKDMAESIAYLESKGVRIMGKMLDHFTELDGQRIHTPYCFIHPKDFFGIMVELAVR
jgi:methylmalonyl-CoA epimerase